MYLTFIANDTGTFKFTNEIDYSIDNGSTWVTLAANTDSPSLDQNDEILWRGTLTSTGTGIGTFSSTASFSVKGNVMSLIYGANYTNQLTLTEAGTFTALFKNAVNLYTTTNLELPATTLSVNCYKEMFYGCTSLTTVPTLSATTLVEGCYQSMFYGCTSLTTVPTLSATTLAKNCYNSMFYGCTSLPSCPTLPGTTLAEGCYQSMFQGCTTITACPSLTVTSLATNCYNSMFYGCTHITSPTSLPATIMVSGCYQNMYRECTALTSIPSQLSNVTTLAVNCWNAMFMDCTSITSCPALPQVNTLAEACYASFLRGTSITTAPNLPASPTLAKNCYYAMFMDCANLANNIPATLNGTLKEGCYYSMYRNCPYITTAPNLPATGLAINCYGYMFAGCTGLNSVQASLPGTTLQVNCYQYMFQGCTSLTTAPEIAATGISSTAAHYGCRYMFAGCTNLTTPPSQLKPTTVRNYLYQGMFQNCTSLVTAPVLNGTSLGTYCYQYMFQGCTSLTNPPVLKAAAINQYSYSYMFQGCTSLVDPPVMNATSLSSTYACNYMFQGCTSLTTAPNLPFTTLRDYCFQSMFAGCTSLVNVQETLPALTLNQYCYSAMFNGCTSLVNPPKIAATTTSTTHACSYMFQNCTSMIHGPQILSATTGSNVFNSMFNGCVNMVDGPLELNATSVATYAYANMFKNCSSLTIAPDIEMTTLNTYSCQSMFEGCSSLTSVPFDELKPVTMQNNCYQNMFMHCTALLEAPEILATAIASKGNNCFNRMFYGCTGLIKAPSEIKIVSLISAGTASAGTFYQMFYGCTSLEIPPEIRTTSLQNYAFEQMFKNCTSLKYAPALPAITLKSYCYEYMFQGCTSLQHATVSGQTAATYALRYMFDGCSSLVRCTLAIKTLPSHVGDYMFRNCTSLKYLQISFTTKPTNALTNNWVSGVPAGGTFVKANGANWSVSGVHGVPTGWTIKTLNENLPLKFIIVDGGDIKFFNKPNNGDISYEKTISISIDNGTTWNDITSSTAGTLLGNFTSSDNVLIRGTNLSYDGCYFNGSAEVELTGNIQSLTYGSSYQYRYTSSDAHAFRGLFSGYSLLTNITGLILPTTYIYDDHEGYYEDMFTDSGVENAKIMLGDLPAMKLSKECYKSMFATCEYLTEVPNLPALMLAENCYEYMFGYNNLLGGDSSMPPNLPALTLAKGCYKNMFQGCQNLVNTPKLPAIELQEYCYEGMFSNCTSLETAPILPAETLVHGCYENMFKDCENLNTIKAYFTTSPDPYYTLEWVDNVAESGTFYKNPNASWLVTGTSGIPAGWIIENAYESAYFSITRSNASGTIQISFTGNTINSITNELQYKRKLINEWVPLTGPISIASNETIYFKGNCNSASTTSIGQFNLTSERNPYIISGNIMSLLYGDEFSSQNDLTSKPSVFKSLFEGTHINIDEGFVLPATILSNECYDSMFKSCTSLTTAPELPATTLTQECYHMMFYGCQQLTTAPKLPATTLAESCYESMFYGCTSLTTPSELPATTLATSCYQNMFDSCTGLTTAPELPASTLTNYCYAGMFENCTALTSAPELPASTLANSCYSAMFLNCSNLTEAPELPVTTLKESCYSNMFNGCTQLLTAPVLPATTLVSMCYEGMFQGCTRLYNAPELPALTLVTGCYFNMFYGCSNLNYIKAKFTTTPGTSYTTNWVYGVASTGTFIKNSTATWTTTGVNGVPTGWTTKSINVNSYAYIDPTFIYSGDPISLTEIKDAASIDLFDDHEQQGNHIPNYPYNNVFILNNWKRTFPWAQEENIWKQIINSNVVNFGDSDYNTYFNNYYQFDKITYILDNYTSWNPFTAHRNTCNKDLFTFINIDASYIYPTFSGPWGACWPLYTFLLEYFFQISTADEQFTRTHPGGSTYLTARSYNNISLLLASIYIYFALASHTLTHDGGDVHILNGDYTNDSSVDITKPIAVGPISANGTILLKHIDRYYWGSDLTPTEGQSLIDEFEKDINIVGYHSPFYYRILFPILFVNGNTRDNVSFIMEISSNYDIFNNTYTNITIDDINYGLTHMFGNDNFIFDPGEGDTIQGIYEAPRSWNWPSLDRHRLYIHIVKRIGGAIFIG